MGLHELDTEPYLDGRLAATAVPVVGDCPCGCERVVMDRGGYLLPMAERVLDARVRFSRDRMRVGANPVAAAGFASRLSAVVDDTVELYGLLIEWCHGEQSSVFSRALHERCRAWIPVAEALDADLVSAGFRRPPVPPPPPRAIPVG